MATRDVSFEKLPNDGVRVRTLYRVKRGEEVLGYVFSRVSFSYRGTQGRDRGIRLRDFHPIDWGHCRSVADVRLASAWPGGRRAAVTRLLDEVAS